MKRLLAVLAGAFIGYGLWIGYYALGPLLDPLAMLVAKKPVGDFLTAVLGSPEVARSALIWFYVVLCALPIALILGIAAAIFLSYVPHTRILFYSVLAWPVLLLLFVIFIMMRLEWAAIQIGTTGLSRGLAYHYSEQFKVMAIASCEFYVITFLSLRMLEWLRRRWKTAGNFPNNAV